MAALALSPVDRYVAVACRVIRPHSPLAEFEACQSTRVPMENAGEVVLDQWRSEVFTEL